MLDQPRVSDYTIWAVALLMYVCDAATLLPPRQMLVIEAARARLSAVFSESPFTLGGRVLAFAPLLLPHRGAFVAPWGKPWTDDATLKAALASVDRVRRLLVVPRILAAWAFVLLFVAGPVLTAILGTSAAIVYTAAALYPTVFVAIAAVWWCRCALGLTRAHATWLSVEILICPAFLPNLVRKLTAPHPIDADAAQLLLAAGSAELTSGVLDRVERRTEELIAESGPDDTDREPLCAYLATVRGAR